MKAGLREGINFYTNLQELLQVPPHLPPPSLSFFFPSPSPPLLIDSYSLIQAFNSKCSDFAMARETEKTDLIQQIQHEHLQAQQAPPPPQYQQPSPQYQPNVHYQTHSIFYSPLPFSPLLSTITYNNNKKFSSSLSPFNFVLSCFFRYSTTSPVLSLGARGQCVWPTTSPSLRCLSSWCQSTPSSVSSSSISLLSPSPPLPLSPSPPLPLSPSPPLPLSPSPPF